MSYRKITVDGKQYEYVVGKTHTKVKGVGVILNSQIGEYQWNCRNGAECCGESLRVQPKDVANFIKGKIQF